MKEVPAKVYKMLAQSIERLSEGQEYQEGEASVIHNNIEYVVNYEVRRESHTTIWPDHDVEPDSNTQTYVSINDLSIYDMEGDRVTMTMNTEEIEKYFDPWPSYTDED